MLDILTKPGPVWWDESCSTLTFDRSMVAAPLPLVRATAAEKCRCHLLFSAFRGPHSEWIPFSLFECVLSRRKKAPSRTFTGHFLTGSIWRHVASRLLLRLNIHQPSDWLAAMCPSVCNVFFYCHFFLSSIWDRVLFKIHATLFDKLISNRYWESVWSEQQMVLKWGFAK